MPFNIYIVLYLKKIYCAGIYCIEVVKKIPIKNWNEQSLQGLLTNLVTGAGFHVCMLKYSCAHHLYKEVSQRFSDHSFKTF